VAPYYGCQIVRPFSSGEKNVDEPVMLEQLLETLGAAPTAMKLKTHCCGGSLMGTQNEVALRLCRNLLLSAQESGAECIAVTCPLCQINLDAYQTRVNKVFGTSFAMPVLFFTQLMGQAMGLPAGKLGLKRCIIPAVELLSRPRQALPPAAADAKPEVRA